MTARFTLLPADIPLPRGAFVGGGRDVLRYGDQPLCAFTRGKFRPCLHPVWTPAGYVVTAEHPADHPHHRGIWVASDHIGLLMQGPDGVERYEYNFYVDDVFQGRAPGHIRQINVAIVAQTNQRSVGRTNAKTAPQALIRQDLQWIGPSEWGADAGRPVMTEIRWTVVHVTETALILDVTSEVTPATETPVALGPTRHAWFNARIADTIALAADALPTSDQGHAGAAHIPGHGTAWVDYTGPVGGDIQAGLAVQPVAPETADWFIADWGVMTVGHIRKTAKILHTAQPARFSCRFIAHDGASPETGAWAELPFAEPETVPNGPTGDIQ